MSSAAPYTNRDLFSTHFLDDLLPSQPEWTGSREERQRAFETLQALYRREAALLPTLKEKQLESRWVREVFRALGVVFEVGPRLPTDVPAVTLEPDYALFATEVDLRLAQEQRSAGNFEGYFQRARAVGDAKRWGTDFGSAARGQKTPRQQITQYIHLSGVAWGLLTDGRLWRLTHRSVAGRLDRYYEVDLAACLEAGDLERFGCFYVFFRGAALRPSGAGGPCFLDAALRESSAYAEAVGRALSIPLPPSRRRTRCRHSTAGAHTCVTPAKHCQILPGGRLAKTVTHASPRRTPGSTDYLEAHLVPAPVERVADLRNPPLCRVAGGFRHSPE